MDYTGVTLRDLYKEGKHKFTEDEICFIAIELLNNLEFIHNQGIIH